ncbi:unnamed protein product [Rotaria sp. Silwood2]|nr:unnamed protein product [Rotaria sp. Silwood2]
MNTNSESDVNIIRSGTRIRESIRCLPKGHFQQIRQMFDKQSCSTIHERQSKLKSSFPSHVLLKLPVTDDEKLQHTTTNIDDIVIENDKSINEQYLSDYQVLRTKLMNKSIQHCLLSLKQDEQILNLNSSLSNENQFHTDTLSYTPLLSQQLLSSIEREKSILTYNQRRLLVMASAINYADSYESSPTSTHLNHTLSYTPLLSEQLLSSIEREKSILTYNQRRQLVMASAINYADSYESSPTSTHLNRLGSTRQYASNLQRTLAVHAKPVLVKTTCNVVKHNPTITYDNNNELFQSTRSLQSSISLSSTGYDSNSSPSIISKRNSLITDRTNDQSLSSDERQSLKPWILHESGIGTPVTIANSYSSDEIFDSTSLNSRSNIKLNHSPSSTLEHHPISIIRHATIRNSSRLDSPSISSASSTSSSAKFIVQTTSFPDSTTTTTTNDIKTNHSIDRSETFSLRRNHKLNSTNSTGFQIQQRLSIHSPIVIQKSINEREESPLPIAENPLFKKLPPRKPPRTFEHENRYNHLPKTIDQKVPSLSSSTSDSPTFDLGSRSISCMDLTAGVSSALLSSGLLPLDTDDTNIECKSNILFDNIKKFVPNENIYEELQTPLSTIDKQDDVQKFLFNNNNKTQTMKISSNYVTLGTSTIKTKVDYPLTNVKSAMKKGISEPNLAKTKSSHSTFFSPRALIDRFKRILPLSLSKQSLNDTNTVTIDSDDSVSISSENNDDIRTSRLDHVSRVKNIYDSLSMYNAYYFLI